MDVDGNSEDRSDTVSVFNGPQPQIKILDDVENESLAVGNWLAECTNAGIEPHEIGVFVRSEAQIERAENAVCPRSFKFDHWCALNFDQGR